MKLFKKQNTNTTPSLNKKQSNNNDVKPYYAHLANGSWDKTFIPKPGVSWFRMVEGSATVVPISTIYIDDETHFKFTCPENKKDCLISKAHMAAKQLGLTRSAGGEYGSVWPQSFLYFTLITIPTEKSEKPEHKAYLCKGANDDFSSDKSLGKKILTKIEQTEDDPSSEIPLGEYKYDNAWSLSEGRNMKVEKKGKGMSTTYEFDISAKVSDISKNKKVIDENPISIDEILLDYTKDVARLQMVKDILQEFYGVENWENIQGKIEENNNK